MIESGLARMKAVAEMLGVELGEEFDIKGHRLSPYKFTECGLVDRTGDLRADYLLVPLLTGDKTITKRPKAAAELWEPKEGEQYWYVSPTGGCLDAIYLPEASTLNTLNYRIGNCFPDEETAKANKDIMLQKFKTPELTPASWTPEVGEEHWRVYDDGVMKLTWGGDSDDYTYKATGNIYRTKAEALADYPNISKRLGMPEVNA